MVDVNIVTLNVRGLRQVVKRRTIFRFLHQEYPHHVVVLQETHSSPQDTAFWQAEWGAPIVLAHGPSTGEAGIAVLMPRALAGICTLSVIFDSGNGRLLATKLDYDQAKLALFAVYAPTQSYPQEQLAFLKLLQGRLRELLPDDGSHILLAGDFNVHLSKLDVSNCRFRLPQAGLFLKDLLNNMNLVDVWRDKYKKRRRYKLRCFNPL